MMDPKRRNDPVVLTFERQLARALFVRELEGEALLVTEHGQTMAYGTNRALFVMWTKTKTDVRERCIAEARALVDGMCDDDWFWKGANP